MLIDNLKHFNRRERWGRPTRMNGTLLLLFDALADRVKSYYPQVKFIVHSGWRDGDTGQHPLGNAVDFHVSGISPFGAYKIIAKVLLEELQAWNHVGFGVYPDWENQGFHLDVRGTKARWSQVGGKYCGIDDGIKLLKR